MKLNVFILRYFVPNNEGVNLHFVLVGGIVNPLTPNENYRGRTAPLTS